MLALVDIHEKTAVKTNLYYHIYMRQRAVAVGIYPSRSVRLKESTHPLESTDDILMMTRNILSKPNSSRISHRNAAALNSVNTVISHSRMTIPSTNSGTRIQIAEATNTLIVTTSVIITILPIVLFFLSLSFCEITDNSQCVGILNEWAPYFEQLLVLIHETLNPIMGLLISNELRLLPKL